MAILCKYAIHPLNYGPLRDSAFPGGGGGILCSLVGDGRMKNFLATQFMNMHGEREKGTYLKWETCHILLEIDSVFN